MPLAIARKNDFVVMPADTQLMQPGDEVLFAGTLTARRAQVPLLCNENVRDYVLDGIDRPAGWVWQWWARRRQKPRTDGAA